MKMHAMVLHQSAPIDTSPLKWEEVDQPSLKEKEALIEVEACAVCRTDLHVVEGDLPAKTTPIIPGHQVIGRVIQLGSSCSRLKIGDRVGIAWLGSTCKSCSFCTSGKENLCEQSQYTGYMKQGGFAEYSSVQEDYVYLLPKELPHTQAPLLCSGIIGYRAYKHSKIQPKETIVLFGFGGSAHVVIQIALYHKCTVYVVTRDPQHQKLAQDMGAHWVGDLTDPLPQLAHSAIIFAPAGPIVPYAMRSLRKGGTACIAGIHMSPIPEMEYEPHLFHEKTLCSIESNTREDGKELLELALTIPIRCKTTSYPIQEANRALLDLKEDRIQGSALLEIQKKEQLK